MQKGKIIENIKFLIESYHKELMYALNHLNEYPEEVIECYENYIIELKFILTLEGIDYE